jgi:nucleotide-binding universal stress UspA family protein
MEVIMDADSPTAAAGDAGSDPTGDVADLQAHAERPAQEPGPRTGIVVGHDGSDCADHALEVALGLAADLNVPLTIVRAWSIDTAPRPANWEFGYVSSYSDYATAVTDRLKTDARSLVHAHPSLAVEYRVALGGAAKSLIDVSRGSRMLVVGSRGRGGLAGMLLGSVSEQCVRHAECPVLVVRPST